MSIGHDLTVLELESQIDVLSRIQFVSRFGSNLVHIEGDKGSGKSWLAQRYLEKWCDNANQALLMCHGNQSVQQQRGIILKQIVRDPLFNESDSIVDSVGRMLAGEKCNIVLVVDDAHLLSLELMSELWLLVQKAQSAPNWQINVLLFSEKDRLTQNMTQMSYGQDNKPVDIEIEPLSKEEASTFSEMLVVRFAESREDKARIRNLVRKSRRLPAELIALGEKKTERRVIIRSVTRSPVGVLGLASVLLIGAAGTYWWMNQASEPLVASVVDSALDYKEALVINDTLLKHDEKSDLASQNIIDDSGSIPPEVMDTPVIAETTEAQGKRVVVPSELVDSLVDNSQPLLQPEKEAEEKNTETSKVITSTEDTPSEVTHSDKKEEKPLSSTVKETIQEPKKSEVAPKSQEKKDDKVKFVLADKELKSISEKRYILQLAALTNEHAVQEFLDEHSIQRTARIYQALRNGSIWYIVTTGDYASISAARGAVKTLPSSVQTLGPWAKSLVQVHREIDSVK